MGIPPSLHPFLRRKPILLVLFMVVIVVLKLADISSNIEYLIETIPLVGSLFGNVFHYAFNTNWGLLLFLICGLVVEWLFVKAHLDAAKEYQGKSPSETTVLSDTVYKMVRRAGPIPSFEFNTQNRSNEKLEVEEHVQSVRFIKPTERVIRANELPSFVYCEHKRILRLRNWVFGIAKPRIVVKEFTENGIVFDEENTSGTEVVVEFYLSS